MATVLIIVGAAGLVVVVVMAIHKNLFRKWKLRDALAAIDEAQYNNARNILESISLSDSRNALVYWLMARCSLELKETNRAVGEYRKVLQVDNYELDEDDLPHTEGFSEVGIHELLRDIFKKANQEENVFQENQILMTLEPDNADHPYALAESLIRKKEFSDRTVTFLNAVLQIESQHAEAYTMLALVYFKQGNSARADSLAKKAIEIQPGLLDPQYFIGEALYKNNEHEQAMEFLEKAAMSSLFQKSATFTLAKINYQLGKLDEAETWVLKCDACPVSAHEDEEIEWEVKYLLGLIHQDANKQKEAFEVFENIQKYRPGFKDVVERLKKVDPTSEHEFLKDFLTAKSDLYATLSEELVNKMGYDVQKIEVGNDGSLSMLAKSRDMTPVTFAVFVRRNYDLINADMVQNLRKYKSAMNCDNGIFINTGEFTGSAREVAGKFGIELVNGDRIEALLAEMNKTSI